MKPRLATILAHVNIQCVKILDACISLRLIASHQHAFTKMTNPQQGQWIRLNCGFLLLLFPAFAVGQTTVIVRLTPTDVVVGVDSLQTRTLSRINELGRREEIVDTSLI